ncbi:MAG: 2-amino-4-hydroxy-6-hydroxymethyldihydropteridine diphosphokinase [Nitrospiraceae bacterium]|nr:MAG: 2-amino-4-hydroxy-6-hydroxymethyldihydropteridine diphosphokinase [Nitrospiraceae bacterium]
MSIVYIGIGSNLGKREENCERAISFLINNGITIIKKSSLINTEPWGFEDQPAFVNMAVSAETDLTPDKILTLIKEIEVNMGRTATVRWGPRIIDLDILFYDDLVFASPDLSIPHPQIEERDFVLKPLEEIAPDLVHPVLKKSMKELRANYLSRQDYSRNNEKRDRS